MRARKIAADATAAVAPPVAPAEAREALFESTGDVLHSRLTYELVPLLAALALLTDALRVLGLIQGRARFDPDFAEVLSQVSPTWSNPLAFPTTDVVADLAQLASDKTRELAVLAITD